MTLNYLEKVHAIPFSQNPARQILELGAAPEKPDLLPVAFPPEDLDQLFRYLENAAQSGDREATRDLALLRFAYVTACRRGEIARLTLDCLDLEGHTAVILAETSKSKRLRTVCFDDDVCGTMRNWLAVRPSVKGVREVMVSLGGRLGYGQPMKPQALYAILQRQSDAAKISRRKFHALRHTGALDALEEGIDVVKVQAQLGHASIETTMLYMRGRVEDRARAYRDHSLSSGLARRVAQVKV